MRWFSSDAAEETKLRRKVQRATFERWWLQSRAIRHAITPAQQCGARNSLLVHGSKLFAARVAENKSWFKRLLGGEDEKDAVAYQTPLENIYHCCVHKTASQWIAKILADDVTYRFCGLKTHRYQRELPGGADDRPIRERTFNRPFPHKTIVTPIYIGLENFLALPKPAAYRAFFVMRDPRDVLVSWYFSWKHSHQVMADVGERREQLQKMSGDEGLIYGIENLAADGLFNALRSWNQVRLAPATELMVVRYEDLIDAEQFAFYQRLFAHCDIRIPEEPLRDLLQRHSFAALARGRDRGIEDVSSHLRKGIHGDWKNHFSPAVTEKFRNVTGDLIEALGYSW